MYTRKEILADIVLRDSPFPWWEWDVINNKVTFNDLKVTMLGYKVEDFKDKGYEAFTNLLHPDDYEKTMDAMRDLLSGRKNIYQIDYRIIDNQKRYHWYMDRGVVIAREGDKISKIRGIVIDLGMEGQAVSGIDKIIELLNQYSVNQDKLITICSSCRLIKTAGQEWIPTTNIPTEAITDTLSHGICPNCLKKLYPDFSERILSRRNK